MNFISSLIIRRLKAASQTGRAGLDSAIREQSYGDFADEEINALGIACRRAIS
jgi:hypothetical protein